MRAFLKALFGAHTIEYISYRLKRRRNATKARASVNESQWVAAEYDWPAQHENDLPSQEAAEQIWSETFSNAAKDLTKSFQNQPVANHDEDHQDSS
jgi:hypothetical protein